MKLSFLSVLFFLSLLAMALSCKKDRDVHPTEEWFTDPTNLPQPPQGCKIVKTTYKDPSDGRTGDLLWEPETITLDDGRKMPISCVAKTTYLYDNQNRILEIRTQLLNNLYWLYKYTYTRDFIITYQEYLALGTTKPAISIDTTSLNDQGLINRRQGLGEPFYFYSQDNQLVDREPDRPGQSQVYVDGNMFEYVVYQSWGMRDGEWFAYDRFLKHYSYLTTRPNLPVIHQFRGNESHNLPLKEIWQLESSPDFGTQTVYQKTYTYWYDQLGQVKRRIVHGKPLIGGWLIEDDLYGVGVTDFEYECS
ncbi:hypothetical protein [Larkinella rosea]|uniref:DUF4595 domain-containing protein n=1 Tax=Larkinella rosea TaxID=2025312 RepID=A0A3P1BNY1_9BACT|nr:hypothetical protein [Larkinella rosea]RRB02623.1 hypothetical protein EHT25_19435 [Larkinella rosea]